MTSAPDWVADGLAHCEAVNRELNTADEALFQCVTVALPRALTTLRTVRELCDAISRDAAVNHEEDNFGAGQRDVAERIRAVIAGEHPASGLTGTGAAVRDSAGGSGT